MNFKEMIEHLYKIHEFSRNFAQRREIEQCVAFALNTYERLKG